MQEPPTEPSGNEPTATTARADWQRLGRWLSLPAVPLILFAFLAISSMARKSAVYDEPILMASGARFLRTWDNSVNPENPPLLKAFYALPTFTVSGLEIPPVPETLRHTYKMSEEFAYGHEFLYGKPLRGLHGKLLFRCRLMVVLTGVLLGLVLYRAAASTWGRTVAVVLLWIYALSPNVLAHARFFTPDLGCTLFVFLTVLRLHLLEKRGRWLDAVWFGLALGGVLLTKFTGVLLLPCIAAQLVVHLSLARRWRRPLVWKRLVPQLLLSGVVALVLLNAFYLGKGFGHNLKATEYHSSMVRTMQSVPVLGSLPLPVPADYLRGFDIVANNNRPGFPNIFLGKLYPKGGSWWNYYLVALGSKMPLVLLGAVVWGIFCGVRSSRRNRLLLAEFSVVPILLFLNFSIVAYRQLGLRYILPLWPFLILAVGFAVRQTLQRSQALTHVRRTGVVLLVLYTITALSGYPDYLSYFNVTAGGEAHGWKRLASSNTDWGQDLPALARWQRQHGYPEMDVLYHGQASLEAHGVRKHSPGATTFPLYIAISVTNYYLYERMPIVRYLRDHGLPVARAGGSIHIHALDRQTLQDFGLWAAEQPPRK